MKKILLSAFFIWMAFVSYSQIEKQKIFIGGNTNFSYNNDKGNSENGNSNAKSISVSLIPSAGYFITKKFAVGLGVGYQYYHSEHKSTYINTPDSKNISTGNSGLIELFTRYNQPIAKRVSLFGRAGVTANFGKRKIESSTNNFEYESKESFKSFSTGIRPGFIFFVTDRIGIETTFGYVGYEFYKGQIKNSEYGDSEYESNSFTWDFGLSSLYLGIQFYLGNGNPSKKEK